MQQQPNTAEWWKLEGNDLHTVVVAAATDAQQHEERTTDLVAWRDLYVDAAREDWALRGLFRDRRARNNVIQNATDTVHAKLSKSRTRPWIVTANGDWKARYRAKMSTLWLDGQFERLKIYELGDAVLHDSAIFGDGVGKFYVRHGKPHAEIVWCGDLFVDRREERYRCVRTLYQVAGYDRGVLAAMHPKHREAILAAKKYDDPLQPTARTGPADLVMVVEAWRLPDGPDTPGRHCICIDKATIADEEWERDTFPFEFLHWSRDPLRFWGVGLVERMSGTQAELNLMTSTIEEAYRRCPPASIWIEASSQVDTKRISNLPWEVHTYSGANPPTMLTPGAIAADFSAREEVVMQRLYQNFGISQLSAQGQKPAGLNSGKALMVHQDIESERFYAQAKALENWYVGAAKQLLALADEIANDETIEDKSGLDIHGTPRREESRGPKSGLQEVKYMDAMLGDMPHVVRVFPVASLASSPQGRLQQVADLMQLGILTDPNDARELLEFPDLDRFNSVESAGRDLVEQMIGECLQGKPVAPHPLIPLDYAIRKGTLEHDLAELQGAGEKELQALRDFIAMAETLMTMAAPPETAASQPAGPAAPPMPADPTMGGAVPPMPMGAPMPPDMGMAS
jgi:hypothetical protein